MAKEFNFEIKEHLCTLSEGSSGWTLELNLVSFNGSDAKYDLRRWSPDHQRMGKGISLTYNELQTLADKAVTIEER